MFTKKCTAILTRKIEFTEYMNINSIVLYANTFIVLKSIGVNSRCLDIVFKYSGYNFEPIDPYTLK